jgi:uncharacterized protein YoaH (UPF0181 family)
MVQQQEKPAVKLAGTPRERELAAKALELLMARGMFMSSGAVIKVSAQSIAAFLETQGEADVLPALLTAVAANPDVFGIEEFEASRLSRPRGRGMRRPRRPPMSNIRSLRGLSHRCPSSSALRRHVRGRAPRHQRSMSSRNWKSSNPRSLR